jgi:hypothetical protein
MVNIPPYHSLTSPWMRLTSCISFGSHASHEVHMPCSFQIICQGMPQRPPRGQARQCSGSVIDAWGNKGSCRQDKRMVPSLLIVQLTSGTYGPCRGQQVQAGNNNWLKLKQHVLPFELGQSQGMGPCLQMTCIGYVWL